MPRSPLAAYDAAAARASAQVIAYYSTSFSLAAHLLRGRVRTDIRNLYAVVRIADELVDAVGSQAGLSPTELAAALDAYETAVLAAPSQRFHTDPVLHAYAATARHCDFDPAHIRAFFASMRRDLTQTSYTPADFDSYIYGSAEVIGLLCLDCFLADRPATPSRRPALEDGARRLGAAFQKVNFLRDLAADTTTLGRTYFPMLADRPLNDAAKDDIIADIRADLTAARAVIPELPASARLGVTAATDFFSQLTDELSATPADAITTTRVRVSAPRKAALLVRSLRSLRV